MNNHILLKILVALVISTCGASAINLDNLVGTWTGQRKEMQNGVGAYSKVTLKASIREDGGLLIVERGKWPDLGKYVWKHNFHMDGKYTATAKSASGLVYATTTGTWVKADGEIKISGTNRNFSGSAPFKGTLKRDSRKRLVYSGKSGTLRVVITGNHR